MTEQEIFNRVWDHLNRQGRRAVNAVHDCLYRTKDGLACAVGCLVDDATAAKMDARPHTAIDHIAYEHIDVIPADLRGHVAFLSKLQQAHDENETSDWLAEWRVRMHVIARQHNLTVPSTHQLENVQ